MVQIQISYIDGADQSEHLGFREDGVLIFSSGKSAWQGIEEFHGARMFWSHPDSEVTRQYVVDAGFAVLMSEVLELGGEQHYWVMARKST